MLFYFVPRFIFDFVKAGYLIIPLVCCNSPAIILNQVVFPLPFSPTTEVISPNFNSNSDTDNWKSVNLPEYFLVISLTLATILELLISDFLLFP
ncbi:hypothetical protein [Okeania sp. KiyG1]|uniref:hypothetical protein n=1 Tax=Okeania sp. KiyG1 TaxID=2720165 RepID=UPI001924CC32|nr:hypothetical protein [Okeania sp. KiyG1]